MDTGDDAWLLDPSERLAAQLARDGEPREPIYIEDSDTRFAIGWNGHYHADGEAFVYSDRRDRSRYHDSRLPNAQDRSTGLSRKFQISLARTSPKFQGATGSKALI